MLCLVVFRPSSSPLGSPSLSESAKQSCSVNLWPFLWKSLPKLLSAVECGLLCPTRPQVRPGQQGSGTLLPFRIRFL